MSINEKTRSTADILKAKMTLGDNGVVTVADGAFEDTLEGTGLTIADFKKVQDHRDTFIAAQGLALGEIGVEAFKKNKKLDQITVEQKVHKDVVSSNFKREKDYPNAQEPGTTIKKFGVLSSKVQANGAGNKGQLKLVRQHLNEEARKVLAG